MTKVREGYKETEIGVIPEEWELTTLDRFVESNSYGPRFNAKLYSSTGNCKVIRGTDVIKNGQVNYNDIPIAQIPQEVLDKHILIKKDFVVVTTADCGISFVFNQEGIFMPSAYMVRIRFTKEINSDFICYFFDTKFIKKQVFQHVRKGTIGNLPGSDLLKFKILYPPLPEQQRIAEILSTTDEHIEKLDKTIEDHQLLKKGMMQKLLTEGIGHTEFKDTEIGRIPKEWEVKILGDYIKVLSGSPFKSSLFNTEEKGLPIIRIRDIIGSKISTYYSGEYDNTYIIKWGDILIGMDGEFHVEIWNNENALLNQRVCKIQTDIESILLNDYLFYSIKPAILDINLKTPSTTVKHLSVKDIKNIKFALPKYKEQKDIANLLLELDNKTDLYIQEQQDFILLKKSLMEKLLTGKIRTI